MEKEFSWAFTGSGLLVAFLLTFTLTTNLEPLNPFSENPRLLESIWKLLVIKIYPETLKYGNRSQVHRFRVHRFRV
jgi:hypothetical protein